ncbi:hypothetical protein DW68_025285 (plasmid) [Ectopseudomonas mendocina S5.2]|jgi:prepilin-type N-terminal cleavage/methylation domain-containing protein|nr:hypothetical protein DW68_025285 [Pseudomonas mendocina S5.2]
MVMRVGTLEKHSSRGFTLIELLIAVAVFGVLIVAITPFISMGFQYRELAKRDEHTLNMQKIAGGIMNYARTSNGGRLPAPYTGGSYKSTIYNSGDTSAAGQALSMELRNTGVPVNAINDDNSAVQNVRVYQRVSGLTQAIPFYFSTGTNVTLTYDVGALVQTKCPLSGACNTAIPGDSPTMTAANVTTWAPAGEDYGGIVFSTLPEQKAMLRQTTGRLNRLADKLASEFYTRLRLAAANSTNNFFPLPNNAGAPSYVGRNPVVNMGCHNGWYRLSDANVNVLAQIGLDPSEFGVTAWGGAIEYCQDYEPTASGTSTANTAPHYAALRINRSVSLGAAPTGVLANDVVITF